MKTQCLSKIELSPCPWAKPMDAYVLDLDVRYRLRSGREIVVPMGFHTDLASVPWWLWPIIGTPADPKFWEAAVLHDYIYRTGCEAKAVADRAFCDLLEKQGVATWRRTAMYLGVRLCGGSSYRKRRKYHEKQSLIERLSRPVSHAGRDASGLYSVTANDPADHATDHSNHP